MWHYAAAGLVALAVGFTSGWQVRAWKAGADQAAALEQSNRDQLRRAEQVAAASTRYEQAKADRQAATRIRDKEADRAAQDPVLARECLSDDSLRILAGEVAARGAGRQPRPALSGPAPADKQGG